MKNSWLIILGLLSTLSISLARAEDPQDEAAAEPAPVVRARPVSNYTRRTSDRTVEPGDEWKPDPRNF